MAFNERFVANVASVDFTPAEDEATGGALRDQ
jgi:hypothetical protein